MKKIITVLVLTAMLLCTLGVAASAESYIDKVPPTCEYSVTVKKANPAVVKKDGVIDVAGGEYIKAEVPLTELSINFGDSAAYTCGDLMSRTLEYYFSWDDTHGFNFAVKYLAKGTVDGDTYDGYATNFPEGTPDEDGRTKDDFCYNLGLNFASGTNKDTGLALLYYSVSKDIATGNYIKGHWNQLGYSGAYNPTAGQDFVVNYPGDGSVVYEWSVPFSEILSVAAADGVSFNFNLTACAGTTTAEKPQGNNWTVSLGQQGFLVASSKDNAPATAVLSTEMIPSIVDDDTTVAPAGPATSDDKTTPAPTQPVTTRIETSIVTETVIVTDTNGEIVTDNDGNQVTEVVSEVVTNVVTDAPSAPTSPITGDPAVIAAVVAAISACGVVVAKKRK